MVPVLGLALVFAAPAVVTKAPELLSSVSPEYPEAARAAKRGGTVSLQITLDVDGTITRVDVAESAGVDLDWAALGAATQFTFSPGEIDGKPAAVALIYQLAFEVPTSSTTAPGASDAHAGVTGAASATGAAGVGGAPGAAGGDVATFALSGRVRRAGTVEPLAAEVTLSLLLPDDAVGPPITTTTDARGRFSFAALPEGPYRLDVGAEAYDPFKDDEYIAPGVHELDIALVPKQANEFETIVRRQRGEPPVSRISLSRQEVQGIPGTYGDALRVIESLPGVARAPLLGGALMVRGGYPADTSINFEGVPIPVLYHFGGFTSVVNGAFIEQIDFMPGGFPVRYGNATAGIVDVKAHALNDETMHAQIDVDDFDVGFFFGGRVHPLDDAPALKIGFAARRSHAEIPGSLALTVLQAAGTGLPFLPIPVYDDYQLKLEADVNATSTLSLFAFGADDDWAVLGDVPSLGNDSSGKPLQLDDVLNNFLGDRFQRLLLSWEFRPAPGVTNTFRPWIGATRRGLLSDGVAVPLLSGGTLDSPTDELNWGVRDELSLRLAPWLRALVGFEHEGSVYGIDLVLGGTELFQLDPTQVPTSSNASLSTAALYAELQLGPILGISITPGVRAELTSFTFDEAAGLPIYHGKPHSLVTSWVVDPRVSLRDELNRWLALKAAFGIFHERPSAQDAAFDTDGQALSSPEAFQVIGGFEGKFGDNVSLDAQVYGIKRYGLARDLSRLFNPNNLAARAGVSPLGSFDSNGEGDTIGLELFLRHAPSKYFFGWVSYTLSRTEVSLGDHRETWVPFPFDQTHNLVAVGRVNLPWDVTLGARFAFVTGNPSPIADSITTQHDLNANIYTPVLSSLQSSRLDPFQRLDVRVDKRFIFDWCSLVTFLEVINIYNWPNPEIVIPGGDYRQRELRTLLPGPPLLPLIGAELEL